MRRMEISRALIVEMGIRRRTERLLHLVVHHSEEEEEEDLHYGTRADELP